MDKQERGRVSEWSSEREGTLCAKLGFSDSLFKIKTLLDTDTWLYCCNKFCVRYNTNTRAHTQGEANRLGHEHTSTLASHDQPSSKKEDVIIPSVHQPRRGLRAGTGVIQKYIHVCTVESPCLAFASRFTCRARGFMCKVRNHHHNMTSTVC